MNIQKQIYKLLLLICVALLYPNTTSSQNYSSGVGVLGGYVQDGYGILVNYNYYLGRNDFIQGGIMFSQSKDEKRGIEIPIDLFTFQAGYFNSVYSNAKNSFKTNLGIGLIGGYEVINDGKNTLENGAIINSSSKFIGGLFASVEADVYLNEKFNLIFKYNQYYHANSDLGEWIPFLGLGVRYFMF